MLQDHILAVAGAYLAFALLAIVGPGVALQRLARLPVDPVLVIPLGTAFTAGTYWVSLGSGLAWLFPLAVGVVDLAGLAWGQVWRVAPGPRLRDALPTLAGLLVFLAVTQYGGNRLSPTGEFLMDPLVAYDTAFHVGLTWELTLGYPPQVPGVSGFPLGYHLGTDLVRAAALRWAGLHPYHSISRFDVTLWAFALVLGLRAVTARLGGNRFAVELAGWSVLLTDGSFSFGGNPSAVWWADLLRGNILVSLALSNPVVPALGMTLAALLALGRALESEARRAWLVLAGALGFAVPFFKVFLGAHLLLGLGVAFLACRRFPAALRSILIAALPAAIATAALILGQGGKTVTVTLAPLDLVAITRESLGLPPLAGPALLGFAAVWITASLGLRLFGLRDALTALGSQAGLTAALAAMALAAWPLGLLFRVAAPEMLPGQQVINDAAYLVEQGGPLLWVFAALALGRFASAAPARRTAALVALAGLALPSTAQFLFRKATLPPDPLPASMVRAMADLEKASRPGDVVLQRPGARFPPAPVILIGRRVPYERFTPWLTQFATAEALQQRHEAVFRFFRTPDAAEARQIASGLGARFVCLYGPDRLRFELAARPLHSEPGATCMALD